MTEAKKIQSYASTTLNVCKCNNNSNEKLKTLDSYLKNGYSLIKRNPITKKVEITLENGIVLEAKFTVSDVNEKSATDKNRAIAGLYVLINQLLIGRS